MIRRAEAGDRPALEALYQLCFPGEPAFQSWFFGRVWRPEHTLVYLEGDDILAEVQTLPLTLGLDGARYPAHYIFAAGTHPGARGRGLMGRLLGRAFEEGVASGQLFSALITQNDGLFNFYRPFGYTTIARVSRQAFGPAELPGGYAIRPARAGDLPSVAALFEDESAGRLTHRRDAAFMALVLELYGENMRVLEGPGGRLAACALLEEPGGGPSFIKELLGPKKAALAGALCPPGAGEIAAFGLAQPAGVDIGCIKALTPAAEAILAGLACPPYLNVLFN